MNLKKKNKLFDMFIDNEVLTFEELHSFGFSKNELKRLAHYGDIRLLADGTYCLSDVSGMLFYVNTLYKKGNHDRAKMGWERCLDVKPNNYGAATMLFLESLLDENFDKAFEYFDTMERTVNKKFQIDHNLWLLLLSQITSVPDKYKKRISELRIEEVLIQEDDSKYSDKERLNRVRKSIYGCDFDKALYLSHKISEMNSKQSYNVITKKLLDLASAIYKEKNELYVSLINEERYGELVQILDARQAEGSLTYPEQCLFILASDMVSMRQNNFKQDPKKKSSHNLLDAIVSHNYKLASRVNKNLVSNNEALTLMLDKIVEEADRVDMIMTARRLDPKDFAIFETGLVDNDIQKALHSLDRYLSVIGKSEYRNYIYSLIKLRYVKGDMSFDDPIMELARVSSMTYKFNIDSYTQKFYSALLNNDLDKAKTYLSIISSAKTISDINIDIPGMRESLITKMNELGIFGDEYKESDNKATLKVAKFDGKCKEKLATEYSHLVNVFEQMISGDNLVLLEPMSEEDVEDVLYIASCVPFVEGSLIDSTDGKNKHVMLRYRGGTTETVTRSKLINAGGIAFGDRRYEDCIDYFEQSIPIIDSPRSNIYAKLGLAYRALDTEEGYCNAIDYLTAATYISQSTLDDDYDFSSIVENLKRRTGYNGVKVKNSATGVSDVSSKNENVQYKKIDKK